MRNLYNQTKIATEMSDLKTNQDTCKMYLVLDAALWSVEIEPAFEFGNKYCCLFATKGAEDELNDVAPYLFEYEESDELSKWVKSDFEQRDFWGGQSYRTIKPKHTFFRWKQ